MILQINNDHQRFRKIIKGRIREDLRKFLTRGELLGREGKKFISIPVTGIDTPNFRYGDNDDSGIGNPHLEADSGPVDVEMFSDLLTRLLIAELRGQGMHRQSRS